MYRGIKFCLVVFSALSIYLLSHLLEKESRRVESVVFIPSKEFTALTAGTYSKFLADVFLIRGVLMIGDYDFFSKKRHLILKNLEVANKLDPRFLFPIFLGGIVLVHTPEDAYRSISFLKEAQKANPQAWQIPYWIGVNYAYILKDYLSAIKYFRIASDLPGAPPFLKSNQVFFYYKAGKIKLGIEYLEALKRSIEGKGKREEWINRKLEWLKKIWLLEQKVDEFHSLFKRYPENLNELVEVGLLDRVPGDPFGKGFYFDKEEKRVKSLF